MSQAMQETLTHQTSGRSPDSLRDMCTLSNDQLAVRLTEIRQDILPHVRQTHSLTDGYLLELHAASGLREKIVKSDCSRKGLLRRHADDAE